MVSVVAADTEDFKIIPLDYTCSFGQSVSLDGDTVVIGAPGDYENGMHSGAAYVFTHDGSGTWTQQAKLTASDGAANDDFGWWFSLDGDTVLISAYKDQDDGLNSGSVYVFTRDGSGIWTQQAKLTASDGAAHKYFGGGISLDGDTALIGAYGSGYVYVFTRDGNGAWTQQEKFTSSDGPHANTDLFGSRISLDGDTAVIGASQFYGTGSAYVFTRDGSGAWIQQAKLTASGAEYDSFGCSVSLDGDTAVIGASSYGTGSAYVFSIQGQPQTPTDPLSVKITSPNNGKQIIEDEDATFSSQITGGVPPYQYEWVDDFGNVLSNSKDFNINFYNYYGDNIKKFDPWDMILIDLNVIDANGVLESDGTYIYVVPPAPKVEYEVWQNYEKMEEYILEKEYPYEIWIKVTNTDDNPHYYSLKLDTPPENDIPPNLWDAKTKTEIIKNDMQTKLIQPGNTRIFVFEFKSDWEWIPPKSMVDVYWDGAWGIFHTEMAKLVNPKTAIALTITDITIIVAESKIGIPIVNFKFIPQYGSTQTLMGANAYAEVPLYVGQTKTEFYRYYLVDKYGTKIGFLIHPLLGTAAFLNSGLSYNKANDPVNDYAEIIKPEPFYITEINSIQNELHKRAAQNLFDILSYSKAEEISFIRYAGAVEDNEFEYALLQLEAAKKYNDICFIKLENLNNLYKLVVEDLKPLTEEQIDEYKSKISNDGLPPETISILIREGLEGEIPELEEIILDSDPELLRDPSLLLSNNNLKVKIRTDLSNEYIEEITKIKVDQLGQPISEATILDIEEIETLKDGIQLGLDKGYATQELKDNIQLMFDLANALIIRTNNNDYLHYYSFATDAQVRYLILQMPIDISFLPPITIMDQFNLTDGRTLPIKFTARDNNTGEFIYDDTVNVTITNFTGHVITYFTNGTGTDSVRINSIEEQYIVNFYTKNYDLNVGETYAVTVTFGELDSLRGYEITYFTLMDGGKAKGKG